MFEQLQNFRSRFRAAYWLYVGLGSAALFVVSVVTGTYKVAVLAGVALAVALGRGFQLIRRDRDD